MCIDQRAMRWSLLAGRAVSKGSELLLAGFSQTQQLRKAHGHCAILQTVGTVIDMALGPPAGSGLGNRDLLRFFLILFRDPRDHDLENAILHGRACF